MAAVRVERTALTDPRIKILAQILGIDVYSCLGRMVHVWAFCTDQQKHSLSKIVLDALADLPGFADALTDAGLAEQDESGSYRIKGTEGRIEWLGKLRENGKHGAKGGRPRKENPNGLCDENPHGLEVKTPLTLSPAPAPATVPFLKKEEIEKCIETWGITLSRMKIRKSPRLDEFNIARLLAAHGLEKTQLALLGAGYEESSEDYDASKHVSIRRLLKADVFEKFVNLGAKHSAENEKAEVTEWKL